MLVHTVHSSLDPDKDPKALKNNNSRVLEYFTMWMCSVRE